MKVGYQASHNMDLAAPHGWKHLADLSPVKVAVDFGGKYTPLSTKEWHRLHLQTKPARSAK